MKGMKNTKWVSLYYTRLRFKFSFTLFGNTLTFKITKQIPYSNKAKRFRGLDKILRSGKVESISGVRFMSSSEVLKPKKEKNA